MIKTYTWKWTFLVYGLMCPILSPPLSPAMMENKPFSDHGWNVQCLHAAVIPSLKRECRLLTRFCTLYSELWTRMCCTSRSVASALSARVMDSPSLHVGRKDILSSNFKGRRCIYYAFRVSICLLPNWFSKCHHTVMSMSSSIMEGKKKKKLYLTLFILLAAIQKLPDCFLDENQKSYSSGSK